MKHLGVMFKMYINSIRSVIWVDTGVYLLLTDLIICRFQLGSALSHSVWKINELILFEKSFFPPSALRIFTFFLCIPQYILCGRKSTDIVLAYGMGI